MVKAMCAVFGAIAVIIMTSAAPTSKNSQSFLEHVGRVNAFQCGQPQLRSIRPEELGITIESEESLYPSSTVLKRCECAGYCPARGEVCSANETRVVELVFRVNNHLQSLNSYRYIKVNATEEISCSCQPVSQIK